MLQLPDPLFSSARWTRSHGWKASLSTNTSTPLVGPSRTVCSLLSSVYRDRTLILQRRVQLENSRRQRASRATFTLTLADDPNSTTSVTTARLHTLALLALSTSSRTMFKARTATSHTSRHPSQRTRRSVKMVPLSRHSSTHMRRTFIPCHRRICVDGL